jgi:hypothetical protein
MSEPKTARQHNAALTGFTENFEKIRIPGLEPPPGTKSGELPEGWKEKYRKLLNGRIRRDTDLLAERCRDYFKVAKGRVTVVEYMLNSWLTLEEQRDLAIVGRLVLLVDGSDLKRLWSLDVSP